MTVAKKTPAPRKPTSFRRHLAVEAMKRLLEPRIKLTDENLKRLGDAVWRVADAVIEGEKREDGDAKEDGA